MSSTTQVTDFSDLYTSLLNAVKSDTSQTAVATQAKRYINRALHDMHVGFAEKVPWAERRTVLVTQPEYTTGTVTITKGSTTLTGSSTAWNTNNDFSVANARVGGKVVIAGSEEVYEVSAVGGDTSITLATAFIDDDVSAESYVYFEDEYALASDFLRPIDARSFADNMEIEIISRTDFRRLIPRNKTTGRPKVATILDLPFSGDTTPVRKVRFWRPPNAAFQIPYTYITSNLAVQSDGTAATQLSNDDDEPIVPLRYRHAIVFHALYHWYRDRKDDSRSQEAKAEYVDLMTRMVGDQEIGSTRPRFAPRIGGYRSRARRPYRNNGRYTAGSSFDEIRS